MSIILNSCSNLAPLALKAILNSLQDLSNISITFAGHFPDHQLYNLRDSLTQLHGPFQSFDRVSFHLGPQHHDILRLLLDHVPAGARVWTVWYTKQSERVTVSIDTECAQSGTYKRKAKVSIPLDGNIAALDAGVLQYLGRVSGVDHLELLTPAPGFFTRFNDLTYIPPRPLRKFVMERRQYLRKVTLHMVPRSIGRLILKLVMVIPSPDITLVPGLEMDDEEMAQTVRGGLKRSEPIPKLSIHGSLFSFELIRQLRKLPIRDLVFLSEIAPTFLPQSVTTPQRATFDMSGRSSTSQFEGFSDLQALTLTAPPSVLVDLCTVLAPVPTVTSLTVVIPQLTRPLHGVAIHRRLAALFPGLEHLHFEVQHANQEEQPDWLDIQRLTAHAHLTSLTLLHPLPLILDDYDFACMLSLWGSMQHLRLNPTPMFPAWRGYEVGLTWGAVAGPWPGTARCNGALKTLELYMGEQSGVDMYLPGEAGVANRVLKRLLVGTHGPMHPMLISTLQVIFEEADVIHWVL